MVKRYDNKTRPKPKQRPPEFGGKPRVDRVMQSRADVPLAKPERKPAPKGTQGPHGPRPQTHWDVVADSYDQLVGDRGSEYHQKVVLPGVRRLLEISPGKKILDVACGQGVVTRALFEKGAQVVGIDAARKLLSLAEQRSDPSIRYIPGDVRDLPTTPGIEEGAYGGVSVVLAIQDIHPLPPLFEGLSYVLKPGGHVVIVMMHPAFRGPKATSWGWEGHDVQFRRVDRYLIPRKEPIVSHPGQKTGEYTWSFHRPIETYINGLAKVGLLTDRLEEWASHKVSGPGPRAKAENTAREEIPMFMAIRAVKIPTP
jgi:ubiquinone/menaquinone biosynthesis C-methylase UbiE